MDTSDLPALPENNHYFSVQLTTFPGNIFVSSLDKSIFLEIAHPHIYQSLRQHLLEVVFMIGYCEGSIKRIELKEFVPEKLHSILSKKWQDDKTALSKEHYNVLI